VGGQLGRQQILFVTDGQKRDYLSCALQRARGATKNRMGPKTEPSGTPLLTTITEDIA